MYALKKGSMYVAISGHHSSYTRNIEFAALYQTKEEADANRCGNEIIILRLHLWIKGNIS